MTTTRDIEKMLGNGEKNGIINFGGKQTIRSGRRKMMQKQDMKSKEKMVYEWRKIKNGKKERMKKKER